MATNNSNTHLTIEERRIIRTGIDNGSTKTAIARTIGKDNSTVGKEIKLHRHLVQKCKLPLECANYKTCKAGRECYPECPDFVKFTCHRRDRSPGACNGCSNWSRCHFDKFSYDPNDAEHEYRSTLVDSRTGFNMTTTEAKALADTIGPLLKQGLSPYAILEIHPEIKVSEKTLYTYIENSAFFGLADIGPLDLRRQVNRKLSKKKANLYKKRTDHKYMIGRTYKDYKIYRENNPDVFVVQMDTVYNDETNGPFIQTFKFVSCGLLFAILHETKTAEAMLQGVELLEGILGVTIFRKFVHILLTDRGPEFSAAEAMEHSGDNTLRTRVFYCDPMQSGQKGTLENNHIELRYILPKGHDLRALGLTDQAALNTALSHVNSLPVQKFGGKSPLDVMEYMFPELYEKLVAFGIRKIPTNEIILKPYLLKQQKAEPASVDTGVKPTRSAGRPKSVPSLSDEQIRQLQSCGCSPKEIASLINVSIATYYKRFAKLK